MRIGFIGLGQMGTPMARHLIRSGHEVYLYNRTQSRADALGAEAGEVARTPSDAARDAEVVVTMLADDRAVEEVTFSENGLLKTLRPKVIHLSMSTISVDLSKRLAETHKKSGSKYVAAPVFGRPEIAEAAKLWILAGGPAADVDRCQPIFDTIGQGTFRTGEEPWSANVVKLGGNFLIASMLEALGESFAFIRKSGMEPKQFLEIINTALFKSPIYANYGALIAERRFVPPGFQLKLGLKDIKLTLSAAEAAQCPMPLASLIHDHFLAAVANGQGNIDWSAIAEVAASQAGLR